MTLPDRTNITHDGCNDIIEAWRSGRLIDREAIDYDAAQVKLARIVGYVERDYSKVPMTQIDKWGTSLVDAALGDKETTT